MIANSNLENILTSGRFAVTGELGPPKSGDPEVVRKKARILKGHVDAVNITDCQTAIVRMSSLTAGLLALSEGVEPVMQMTCRDRNRIGIQAEILGASALGIKNLLCLTGDHQKFGNHPQARGVFDMDSIQLLSMMKGMRDDRKFQCGEEIKSHEPRLFLGCAANPFADPFEFRAVRLGKKVDAGANFVQTQIIYNVEKFKKFMEMVCDLGIHEKCYILAGVTPPKSLGMARYMKKFVPGLDVTDEVIQRLEDAADKKEEGINICVDIINQVKEIPGVAGVHIMAIEWEEAVPEIVSRAKLGPRPEPTGIEPVLMDRAAVETAVEKAKEAAERELRVQIDTAKKEADASRKLVLKEKERLSAEMEQIKKELEEAKRMASQKEAEVKKLASELQTAKSQPKEMVASQPAAQAAAIAAPAGAALTAREQAVLNSLHMGLDALKKALGLSDEQYEALRRFLEAEFMLFAGGEPQAVPAAPPSEPAPAPQPEPEPTVATREPVAEAPPPPPEPEAPAELAGLPPVPEGLTAEEWQRKWVIRLVARGNLQMLKGDFQGAIETFKQALAIEPDNEKAKRGLSQAESGKAPEMAMPEPEAAPVETPAAEEKIEVKPAEEEARPEPVVEEKAAPEPEVVKEKEPAAAVKPAPAPKAAPAAEGPEAFELPKETVSLVERAGSISEELYKEPASGRIYEVTIGEGEKAITVGGNDTLPFHLFEGDMPNPPKVAYEVLDSAPEEWPEPLAQYYSDCFEDPVKWAQKCVNEFGAESICVSLVSTDPNGMNRPSDEAAKIAQKVVEAVDVPIILWGCGNAEKDTETLREVTSLIGNKKVCLSPLTDANYRTLGATAMAFQLPVVAATPIDVNLAKQLNILLENLGLPLDHILMDPSIGAVGYGLEYTYSVMERITLAALTQQDEKLAVPFICNLGREVWKAKECRLPSDDILGDQERRGVMMEAITASSLLLAGGALMVMRHPKAVALTESLIKAMV